MEQSKLTGADDALLFSLQVVDFIHMLPCLVNIPLHLRREGLIRHLLDLRIDLLKRGCPVFVENILVALDSMPFVELLHDAARPEITVFHFLRAYFDLVAAGVRTDVVR